MTISDAQFSKLMDSLQVIEIALYQIDANLGLIISFIVAFVVLYAIWYILIRFTWF